MKSTFPDDESAKADMLSMCYNDGEYLGVPGHMFVEEYVGKIDRVNIQRFLNELMNEGLLEVMPNTLGPCIGLTNLGIRMFSKHKGYLNYLAHLEKEKRIADQPRRDLAWAKKWGAIAALLLTVLTAVGISYGIMNNRSIEHLQRDLKDTATVLRNLRQSIPILPPQKPQLPDSAKVK